MAHEYDNDAPLCEHRQIRCKGGTRDLSDKMVRVLGPDLTRGMNIRHVADKRQKSLRSDDSEDVDSTEGQGIDKQKTGNRMLTTSVANIVPYIIPPP